MPKTPAMSRARKEIDLTTYEGRFAARLRTLREKAKMSVEELAKSIGIPKKTLYNWEAGIRTPPFGMLPVLAEELGVKVRNLMPES